MVDAKGRYKINSITKTSGFSQLTILILTSMVQFMLCERQRIILNISSNYSIKFFVKNIKLKRIIEDSLIFFLFTTKRKKFLNLIPGSHVVVVSGLNNGHSGFVVNFFNIYRVVINNDLFCLQL